MRLRVSHDRWSSHRPVCPCSPALLPPPGFSQSPANLIRHVRLFFCRCNHLGICVCGVGEFPLIFLICFRILVYFHSFEIYLCLLCLSSLAHASGQRDLSTCHVNLLPYEPEHGVNSFQSLLDIVLECSLPNPAHKHTIVPSRCFVLYANRA